MEKFRKHADAATGINPFVPVATSPTSILASLALTVFLPIRIVLLLVFALLLFLLDLGMQFLRIAGLRRFVAIPLLFPITAVIGQGFLWLLTGVSPKVRLLTPKRSALSPAADGITPPKPGDLILTNLVTPLDAFFLGSTFLSRSDDAWSVPFCLVGVYSPVVPHIAVFGPSPLQRWKVLRYLLWSTDESFLAKCANAPRVEDVVLDVAPLQARARQLGVPVLLFPEGTTTNGKGILQWAHTMVCDPSQAVSVVSTTYTGSIASHRGTSSMRSVSSWMFASWLSTPSTVFVTIARPSNGPLALDETGKQDDEWVLDTRQRLALAAEYRQAGNHVCKAVRLQCTDKAAFAVHYRETMRKDGGAAKEKEVPASVSPAAAVPSATASKFKRN